MPDTPPQCLPTPTRAALIRRTLAALALVASLSSALAEPAAAALEVLVPERGEESLVLPLGPELAGQALELSLLDWSADGGPAQTRLPGWLRVVMPARLPASGAPIVPVWVSAQDPPPDLRLVDLRLELRAPGARSVLTLRLRLALRARLTIEVPAEVPGLPGLPAEIPVVVRNTGNTAGDARLVATGIDARPQDISVPAGEERTFGLQVTAAPADTTTATVSLLHGEERIDRPVRLVNASAARATGFGLVVSAAVAGEGTLGATAAGPSASATIGVKGNLSRLAHLDLSATLPVPSGQADGRLSLRYRGTTVEYLPSKPDGPTGDVGRGLYAAQELPGIGPVERFTVSAALAPRDWAISRAGLVASGSGWRAAASLSVLAADPVLEASGALGPLNASARWTPQRSTSWEARGTISSGAFSLAGAGRRTADVVTVEATARARLKDSPLGPLELSLQAALVGGAFGGGTARLTGSGFGLGWRLERDLTSSLEASLTRAFGPLDLKAAGFLPLSGAGAARLALDASLPAGPLAVSAGTTIAAGAPTEVRAGLSYGALVGAGRLTTAASLGATVVANGPARLGLTASYAAFDGWSASAEASHAFGGGTTLKLGFSRAVFVSTSPALAGALDGPDPTVRRVYVRRDDGSVFAPVAGARLEGCGEPVVTDELGFATLSGPSGACQVKVAAETLPAGTLAAEPVTAWPRESALITLPASASLAGRVRYLDPTTGEALDDGPTREVRVDLTGPATLWAAVAMPAGELRLDGLPVGTYTLRAEGGPPVTVRLTAAGATVVLGVPGPSRTVLDPAAVTPPLRIREDSPVVAPGGVARLTVSSSGQIAEVIARVGANEIRLGGGNRAPGAPWVVELPIPPGAAGVLAVELVVRFANGAVARRTVQLVVSP